MVFTTDKCYKHVDCVKAHAVFVTFLLANNIFIHATHFAILLINIDL